MSIDVREIFADKYPEEKEIQTSFCPYRICPIGAHSDHQHGLITGFAIDQGITMAYAPTENGDIDLSSLNMEGCVHFNVNEHMRLVNDWCDYLRGVVVTLLETNKLQYGIKGVIYGSLPIGGLSSSAALIICFMSALCKVNGIRLGKSEIINTALRAEKEFVGVNVGTLDQSCEVLSKKDHLLFLDTLDDSFELIPQSNNMPEYEFAIFFSGLERNLIGSAFNMRVDECKAAAYALMAYAGMQYGKFEEVTLRNVPRPVFEQYKDRLPDNWRLRATHFFTEFERVKKGKNYWQKGDIVNFGKMIFESGHSSINNYQTGSPELRTLYNIMKETEGIYGGRFSGAGFKGCCMAVIDPKYKESIAEKVTNDYLKQFPDLAGAFSVHFCTSAEGVKLQ